MMKFLRSLHSVLFLGLFIFLAACASKQRQIIRGELTPTITWEDSRDAEVRFRHPKFSAANPKAMDHGTGYRTKDPALADESDCSKPKDYFDPELVKSSLQCARGLSKDMSLFYELIADETPHLELVSQREVLDGSLEMPEGSDPEVWKSQLCFEKALSRVELPREFLIRKKLDPVSETPTQPGTGEQETLSPNPWTMRPNFPPPSPTHCWSRRLPLEKTKIVGIPNPFSGLTLEWPLEAATFDGRDQWKEDDWKKYWVQKLMALVSSPHFLWGSSSGRTGDWLTETMCRACFGN